MSCPSKLSLIIFVGMSLLHNRLFAQIRETTHGKIEGFQQTVLDIDVETYYGIPFATPPTGELRFKPPVDAKPWNETKQTKRHHNSCHMVIDTAFDRMPGVEMWNPNTPMDEDCLYLNLWVPRGVSYASGKPMTTMVWIFGGGFFSGTPTLDVYNGVYLAASNDVIVASINYRTGPLGFLYMGTSDIPGNMGLLDQQLALRWIFRNIEKFGGDKSSITLFGESAGAGSVGLHLFSPGSKDYFNRVMLHSGSPLSSWVLMPSDEAERRSRQFSKNVGCTETSKGDVRTCLMSKNASVLTAAQWSVVGPGLLDIPFPPVVDREFIMEQPKTLIDKGEYKKTETLLGVVRDEGTFWLIYGLPKYFALKNNRTLTRREFETCLDTLLPKTNYKVKRAVIATYADSVPPSLRDTYRDILDDISGDNIFKCSTIDFGYIVSNHSSVYLYDFNARMESLPWPQWMGVPHGYEIEVLFGLPLNSSLKYTPSEAEFSKRVMKYVSNFAKTGNPNGPNLPHWPIYNQSSQSYAIIDTTTSNYIQQGLRSSQCRFWSSIVPLLNGTDAKPTVTDVCTNGTSPSFNFFITFLMCIFICYSWM